jgi:hypothetical protein
MPNQRQLAETLFERNHGRDAEISKRSSKKKRRAAVIENMQRLRRLRLQRDEKATAGR